MSSSYVEDLACRVKDHSATTRGTSVINMFVQEDRIVTPARRETAMNQPVILGAENAETIFEATRSHSASWILDDILVHLIGGTLEHALVIDNADSATANHMYFRMPEAFLLLQGY